MRASWLLRRYFIPSIWLTITGVLRIISAFLASWVVWLVLLEILIWFAWRLLVTVALHMAKSPTRVTKRPSLSCALSWRFFAVEQWTDFRLDGCWYLWPLFSFYLLGSDWKMRWKLVVSLWKELVQCFYWNRCRESSAARNFDKMATQTTSHNFLLRTKKFHLSIYLRRLNCDV